MIPTELFIGTYRDRLVKVRDEMAVELASTIRRGDMHLATVKSGFIAGLEHAHDMINDVIKDASK